jgi:hypothetical protein
MLQRMHTVRARDSARAQSGGVKGMLTDEDREFLTSAFLFLFPVFNLHSARVLHSYSHSCCSSSPFFLLFFVRGDDPVTFAYRWGLNQLFLFFMVLLTSRCFFFPARNGYICRKFCTAIIMEPPCNEIMIKL